MRAKEFIVEKRQVNEVFPALAGIPVVGGALASMGVGALAWHLLNAGVGAYQAYSTWNTYQDKAAAYGPNILDWPEDEKQMIMDDIMMAGFVSLVGAAAPKFISMVKNKIFTNIPKEAKEEALEKVAPKIEGDLKKIIEKNKTNTSTPTTKSTTMGDKGINAPVDPKQAELKRKLQGQPETPQEKLKRELQAKQAATAK